MIQLLEKTLSEVAKLPPSEHDALAATPPDSDA